jgi:hypothetical protein
VSEHLKPIIEALIFASPEPLTKKAMYKLLDGEPKEDVDAALEAVLADYTRPGGLQIAEVAGGYQIVTRAEVRAAAWTQCCALETPLRGRGTRSEPGRRARDPRPRIETRRVESRKSKVEIGRSDPAPPAMPFAVRST